MPEEWGIIFTALWNFRTGRILRIIHASQPFFSIHFRGEETESQGVKCLMYVTC